MAGICRRVCCCDCSEDQNQKQPQQSQEMKKYTPSNPADGTRTRASSLQPDPLLASPLARHHQMNSSFAGQFELNPSPGASSVEPMSPRLRSPGKRAVRFSDQPTDPPMKLPAGTPVRGIYRHQSSFGPNGPIKKEVSAFGASADNVLKMSGSLEGSFRGSPQTGNVNLPGSGLVSPRAGPVPVAEISTGGREPPDMSLL